MIYGKCDQTNTIWSVWRSIESKAIPRDGEFRRKTERYGRSSYPLYIYIYIYTHHSTTGIVQPTFSLPFPPRTQSLPPTLFIKCTFNFFAGTIIHHPRGVIRLGLRRGCSLGLASVRRGRITNREIHRKMEPPPPFFRE